MNILECLDCLRSEIDAKDKMITWSFEEFLKMADREPERILRNIFQLFHDMVELYVGEGVDEYPDDPESIGFIKYDCSKIFSQGMDNPFFPDRLLANRFVRQVEDFKRGSQQNRMHVYEGPPGCGKSTFLNNLLNTFESYINTKDGQSYEIFWDIAMDSQKVEVPCPSHDHPILIIPKNHRSIFLEKLLSGQKSEIRDRIFHEKEYEWVFKSEACTICSSIFQMLCNKPDFSLDKVLGMARVRPYKFDRRIGEGIAVFNPGDRPLKERYFTDKQIQEKLDQIFGVNRIKYVFSQLARTNNGIHVLMDIKSHNQERLLELHNVISEGVHKVGDIEEKINSLLFALMNPEDRRAIEEKRLESFQARIRYSTISYVLEPITEIEIYRSIFGNKIDQYFLPRVLENVARLVISSRMNTDSKALKDWIPHIRDYFQKHYCDTYGLLLRMEIYSGVIPTWLSEDDKRKFTAQVRRELIAEGEKEGNKGLTGRESIKLFGELLNLYGPKLKDSNRKSDDGRKFSLITMANIVDYFENKIDGESFNKVPENFIDSLVSWYDYAVLNEVKESLYFYNKNQIQEDILHYLCAINYDPDGRKILCQYTGKEIEVTIDFLKLIGGYIVGRQLNDREAQKLAQDIQRKFIEIIARDSGKPITETDLYRELLSSYTRNLKEKVLQPFIGNDNFREAIKSFGTPKFDTFDTRLKEHVLFMIKNLIERFGYIEQGAKEICIYVLDEKLVEKFS